MIKRLTMKAWQRIIHKWAVSKGWWMPPERPLGEQIANMHSELSEAWEAFRNGASLDFWFVKEGKPEGFGVELADAVIRILDTCEAYGIDLEKMIELKMKYNKTRPYRHGGKLA